MATPSIGGLERGDLVVIEMIRRTCVLGSSVRIRSQPCPDLALAHPFMLAIYRSPISNSSETFPSERSVERIIRTVYALVSVVDSEHVVRRFSSFI